MTRITEWTPADLDTLRTMWTAGASSREIAYALGRSRNSVLGKIHRLNLEKRAGTLPRKPEAPRIGRVRSFPPQKHERKPPMLQRVVVVPDAVPVCLMERTGCCYPTTSEKPHLFCNMPTEGKDYCEFHFRIMYPRRAA